MSMPAVVKEGCRAQPGNSEGVFVTPSEGQKLVKAQKDLKKLGRSLDFSVLFCIAASRDLINGFVVFQQSFELQLPEARQLHRNCHLKDLALIYVGTSLKV